MITFKDLKDKEVITVYIQNSTNVFHRRKAVVNKVNPRETYLGNCLQVTLLNKKGKPINGNFFSSWWPICERDLDKTKSCTLYLNEEEVRQNPKAVIKEIITIERII